MKIVDVTVRLTVSDPQWDITARDANDYIEEQLAAPPDPSWGYGRGAINYVTSEVVGIAEVTHVKP